MMPAQQTCFAVPSTTTRRWPPYCRSVRAVGCPLRSRRAACASASARARGAAAMPSDAATALNVAAASPQQQPQEQQHPLWAAVQVPPLPQQQLGARVEHLLLPSEIEGGSLAGAVAAALQLPQPLILALMAFGAVYYCPVPPELRKGRATLTSADPQVLEGFATVRQRALQRWGRGTEWQHPKRVLGDREASEGAYVRIHLHPKR